MRLRLRLRKTLRKTTRMLSRKLRQALNDNQVKPQCENVVMCGDSITIKYTPRRLRIFDSINVSVSGNDVWLPIIQRLLVRHAYRKYVARQALGQLSE